MANKTPQSKHLISLDKRTPEERAAIASKGGHAAYEARKERKTFKDAMEWALDLPAMKGNPDVEKIRKRFPTITNRDAMAISMAAMAIRKGDVRAYVAARDTTGELPEQTVNVKNEQPMTITIKTID